MVPQSISNYYLKTHRKELACAAVRIAHTEWRKCKWLVLQVLTYPEKNFLGADFVLAGKFAARKARRERHFMSTNELRSSG